MANAKIIFKDGTSVILNDLQSIRANEGNKHSEWESITEWDSIHFHHNDYVFVGAKTNVYVKTKDLLYVEIEK